MMNEIRDLYAIHPFKGYRGITIDLKDLGYEVNHKGFVREPPLPKEEKKDYSAIDKKKSLYWHAL